MTFTLKTLVKRQVDVNLFQKVLFFEDDDKKNYGKLDFLLGTDLQRLSRRKLKCHLEARGETLSGSKSELRKRLETSIDKERIKRIKESRERESRHRKVADLEEQGSVYVVGGNSHGQLGMGDLNARDEFTANPFLRGSRIKNLGFGGNTVFGVSENCTVFVWGGGGLGPVGISKTSMTACEEEVTNPSYATPRIIEILNGEEITQVQAGSTHACAVSDGGDVFVWGYNKSHYKTIEEPVIFEPLNETVHASYVRCGESHTFIASNGGNVYNFNWSDSANQSTEAEVTENKNIDKTKSSFPTPRLIRFPCGNVTIKEIACGALHTLALTHSQIYSWGCGAGGRLGHGDLDDRNEPSLIKSLKSHHVKSISAGTWHSACVVVVPPLLNGGYLYTWGSGMKGQLAQGSKTMSLKPTVVQDFLDRHLLVNKIICGSYHNAAVTPEGDLYTWGDNTNNQLGHSIDEALVNFSSIPHLCNGFGSIVGRIGRGIPRSVVCGRNFTIVSTYPYEGPTEKEVLGGTFSAGESSIASIS